MKRTVSKWIGIAVMAGAITFSLIQVRIPVVKAAGCASQPFADCLCDLDYYVEIQLDVGAQTTCYYHCNCGSGPGGGDFLIERDYSYVE